MAQHKVMRSAYSLGAVGGTCGRLPVSISYDEGDASLAPERSEGGPVLRALGGFPKGEAMRPWVRVGQEETLSIRPAVDLDAN